MGRTGRLFNQSVHFIQNRRQLLDFVDHHDLLATGADHVAEIARPVAQAQEIVGLEQVDHKGVRSELGPNQGALSRRARAEQEKRLLAEEWGGLKGSSLVRGLILWCGVERFQ
jgi:hypothetical protein